ncbi:PIN domain-containing protein [Streptomyces griseoincarnatus]|uniref:PIN domain-containing protein n=1 Tax=Streptomyces griseoincarnatus TaxID=29305 RepID=A0ABT0W2Y9_STRGI|nr:PIN domain-containing protein [Streptomyces griseoincarnatus]MCM2517953.1 PIN domain-containing protein [Streptomyces griseoincarnatus]
MPQKKPLPPTYTERLVEQLDAIERDHLAVLEASEIQYVNPNQPGDSLIILGAADWGWAPSGPALESQRMDLLRRLRDWEPRFRLLFPHPTPEAAKKLKESLEHLERWLVREGTWSDWSVPQHKPEAVKLLQASVQQLRSLTDLLPTDPWPVRLVIDTNALIDNPDLAAYTGQIGSRYMAHLLPVVLRELDDMKRAGRTDPLRDAAKKADRRLKGLRTNGDVTRGVRVAGDVHAVFEHIEPKADALPDWLDLTVPDDRFVASTLLLQSRHPGSAWYVATSDINLQTKLSAVALPFIEP